MSPKYDNVLVFGAAGNIGSMIAVDASMRGSKVWLAMRDPSRTIKTITPEMEQSGKFERIKADLSDPESVRKAVETSGARSAFLYFVMDPQGLKPAIEALKETGVQNIVYLSGGVIKKEILNRDYTPETDLLAFSHAKNEIELEDSGIASTFLRPGSFASNMFQRFLKPSASGNDFEVKILERNYMHDFVDPKDIATVGAKFLVEGFAAPGSQVMYLHGPAFRDIHDFTREMAELSGKKITVGEFSIDDFVASQTKLGIPEFLARPLAKSLIAISFSPEQLNEGIDNVRKYAGKEPTPFAECVKTYGGVLFAEA